MADFLTGKELNNTLGHLFESAKSQIIIISPYIKLHSGYRELLIPHKENPKVALTIVFGKNEDDLRKSLRKEDFIFFREFANVEIRYEPTLHAKYYSNESYAILTSMNLYSFSQDNNVEAGVITRANKLKDAALAMLEAEGTLDKKAWDFVSGVIANAEIKYQRFPMYDKKFFKLQKKFRRSYVKVDELSSLFGLSPLEYAPQFEPEPVDEEVPSSDKASTKPKTGYCIRTRKPIPFDINRPFCPEAYQIWARYKNEYFSENFCHYSGDLAEGKTSFAKPVLAKYWGEAKKYLG